MTAEGGGNCHAYSRLLYQSVGDLRAFSVLEDGVNKKIVYNTKTNELVSWDKDNDILKTMFRPGCDTATTVEEMWKKAAYYVNEIGVNQKGWGEIK